MLRFQGSLGHLKYWQTSGAWNGSKVDYYQVINVLKPLIPNVACFVSSIETLLLWELFFKRNYAFAGQISEIETKTESSKGAYTIIYILSAASGALTMALIAVTSA